MLNILKKDDNKTSNLSTGPRNGRHFSYCWSHVCSDITAHTGATCKNKKEGRIKEATRRKKMGVSEKEYSKHE